MNIEELLLISKSQINIQHHNKPRDNKITIMDVDNSYSLTIEMKNSTAMTFDDEIGLDTYSKVVKQRFHLIFRYLKLWLQSELDHTEKSLSYSSLVSDALSLLCFGVELSNYLANLPSTKVYSKFFCLSVIIHTWFPK